MAIITNYATLQTAVADYLARDDLTTFVPNFIQNAENKIYRRLRHRGLEADLSGTIASGELALPTRYNGLKYAYVNTTPTCPLTQVPLEQIYRDYPTRSGGHVPSLIARENDHFAFGPYPAAYDVVGVYYQYPQDLSDGSTTTNWYTDNAPEILLYSSLLEAAPFLLNDPRLAVWGSLYSDAVNSLMDDENSEDKWGMSLVMRAS